MNEELSKTVVPGTHRVMAEGIGLALPADLAQAGAVVVAIDESAEFTEAQLQAAQTHAQYQAGGLQVTREDTLPEQKRADPEVVPASPREYVVGFCFSPDGTKVALIEKDHPAWQKGKYNGIGGHVEPGERIHAAVSREFGEEAGVFISADRWEHFRTEVFTATAFDKADQDAGTKVHHFVTAASEAEWDAIHTAEREKVVKLPYPLPLNEYPNLIYNLVYLAPMAYTLFGLTDENRPLP